MLHGKIFRIFFSVSKFCGEYLFIIQISRLPSLESGESMENEGCCNSWSVNWTLGFPQILWSFRSANPALLYPALPPHYYARKHVRGLVACHYDKWARERGRELETRQNVEKENEIKKKKENIKKKDYRNKSYNKLTQIDRCVEI